MSGLKILEIESSVSEAVKNCKLPEPLGFGAFRVPLMAQATYKDGRWSEVTIGPYAPITLDPSAKVFHYGQEIFEGMKCYKNDGQLALFRPMENQKRLNKSAERLSMPAIPEDIFLNAVASVCHHSAPLVPDGEGESLYLRPFVIATEEGLGLAASSEHLFLVIASPSGGYFSPGKVNVLIEREDCRAAKGGTGAAKCGGNYAGSLKSLIDSNKKGFQQNMWLDASEKKYIEELSGMNFFAVIEGELYTPALTDSILPGITRDSIIRLAKDAGYKVHEVPLDVDEIIEHIKSGRLSEMFACGTAAVLTPVSALGEADGTLYEAAQNYGPVSAQLREALVDIQRGRRKDPYEWVVAVP